VVIKMPLFETLGKVNRYKKFFLKTDLTGLTVLKPVCKAWGGHSLLWPAHCLESIMSIWM